MKPDAREQVSIALYALPAAAFLLIMFAVPLAFIVTQSFSDGTGNFTLQSYEKILSTPLFGKVAGTTFVIAVSSTLFSLVLAYPVAYFLARQRPATRPLWMILILVPFWTSSLVKSFAFTVILGHSGVINEMLGSLGLEPVKLLFNRIGVLIGMSHFLIPFIVFPIMNNLVSQPPQLAQAADIMGAGKLRIFLRITLPLSMPGVVAGVLLAFILSLGFYIVPALLGSRKDMMLSNLVDFYAREIVDVPTAAAIAVLLTAVAILVALLLSRVRGGASILSANEG